MAAKLRVGLVGNGGHGMVHVRTLAKLKDEAEIVALAGQWWVDNRESTDLDKREVATHLVNLTWNGMRHLNPHPHLRTGAGRAASL